MRYKYKAIACNMQVNIKGMTLNLFNHFAGLSVLSRRVYI